MQPGDVGFVGGRGFMRAGLGFPHSDGTFGVQFIVPRRSWSAAATSRYRERRDVAMNALRSAAFDRRLGKLVIVGGTMLLVAADDARPGWCFTRQTDDVVDLLASTVVGRQGAN